MAKPVPLHPTDHSTARTTNSVTAQTGGNIVIRRVTYSLAGQAIAVQVTGDPEPTNNGLFYLHSDHLGSTSAMSDTNGNLVPDSVARYTPFGDWRTEPGTNPEITDRGYTGHKSNNSGANDLGLIYMNARYYVSSIGRFASADTIVPDPANPQSFNRFSYTYNNPLKFTDPSGHCAEFGDDACWSAYDRLQAYVQDNPDRFLWEGSAWMQEGIWDEMATRTQADLENIYDLLAHPVYDDPEVLVSDLINALPGIIDGTDSLLDFYDLLDSFYGGSRLLPQIPFTFVIPALGQLAEDVYEPYPVGEKLARSGVVLLEGLIIDQAAIEGSVPAFELGFYGTLPLAEFGPWIPPAAGLVTAATWYTGVQSGWERGFDLANQNRIFPIIHILFENNN